MEIPSTATRFGMAKLSALVETSFTKDGNAIDGQFMCV
jgi:hypothetical protein